MNCWEFKNCPVERRNDCKAHPDHGKDCWRATGTMCGGVQQLDVVVKLEMCHKCKFYNSPHCEKVKTLSEKTNNCRIINREAP